MISRVMSVGLLALLLPLGAAAQGGEEDHSQHDMSGHDMSDHDMSGHAAHTGATEHIHHHHQSGAWMVEYRFMSMYMDGLLDGTHSISSTDISGALPGTPPTRDPTKPYMMAPVDMTMDMHMLMVMYGMTPRLALMVMGTYRDNDMSMIMHMPMMDMTGDMKTNGFGDSLLGVMYTPDSGGWTASLSVSLPTGSVDETVHMTMGGTDPMTGDLVTITNTLRAPYEMQLGSGTWDLIPSVTYKGSENRLGWGGQASYKWRLGENSEDYTLGNVVDAVGWLRYTVADPVILSGKLRFLNRGRVSGRDPAMNPMMSPSADPNAQGGTRLDLSAGMNTFFGEGHSIGLEFGVPVYQDLNGPQLEADWVLSLTYQYMPMQ